MRYLPRPQDEPYLLFDVSDVPLVPVVFFFPLAVPVVPFPFVVLVSVVPVSDVAPALVRSC
eukprot:2310855-Amphidinium_carterae.1